MTDETTGPAFIVTIDEAHGPTFLNLALVRVVNEIGYEHCRLWFSDAHSVELTGAESAAFIERLAARSRTLNGEAFQWEAPKKTEAESPESP